MAVWTRTAPLISRNMTANEKIAKTFADQFNPPLRYIKTDRVNGVRHADAWQVTYWDRAKSIGITAVVYGGQIHAYLEAAGMGSIAEHAGIAMARALNLHPEPINGQG